MGKGPRACPKTPRYRRGGLYSWRPHVDSHCPLSRFPCSGMFWAARDLCVCSALPVRGAVLLPSMLPRAMLPDAPRCPDAQECPQDAPCCVVCVMWTLAPTGVPGRKGGAFPCVVGRACGRARGGGPRERKKRSRARGGCSPCAAV